MTYVPLMGGFGTLGGGASPVSQDPLLLRRRCTVDLDLKTAFLNHLCHNWESLARPTKLAQLVYIALQVLLWCST